MKSKISAPAAFGPTSLFALLRRSIFRSAPAAPGARLHEAQLRAMSARELTDLGIGASEIPWLLEGHGAGGPKDER